jgi:Tol biopolymer transport system component
MTRTLLTTGLAIALVILMASTASAQMRPADFPKLDGATLLGGYPGFGLAIASPKATYIFQEHEGEIWNAIPSISRDGMTIGAARADGTRSNSRTVRVATFSLRDRSWREFTGPLERVNCISISPDASKLAYSTGGTLHIVDARSGEELLNRRIGADLNSALAWSPTGERIAFDQILNSKAAIEVLDLGTGNINKIADGASPAWSPSGDWIAYLDRSVEFKNSIGQYPANRIVLVRPDGTGSHILLQPRTCSLAQQPTRTSIRARVVARFNEAAD